jgi:predicted amidohydrolase YtcJ
MPNVPPKQQIAMMDGMLKDAVAKAKPGQWIRIIMNWGPDYEWAEESEKLFNKSVTKEYLDQLAPNNPVSVKDGFIGSVANQMAVEEYRKVRDDMASTPRAAAAWRWIPPGACAWSAPAIFLGRSILTACCEASCPCWPTS